MIAIIPVTYDKSATGIKCVLQQNEEMSLEEQSDFHHFFFFMFSYLINLLNISICFLLGVILQFKKVIL